MRKRISFFNIIYIITTVLSSVIFVGLLIFSIVSMVSLNHKNDSIYYDTNIEVYKKSEIKSFNAYYNETDLFILISLYENKDDAFRSR